MRPHLDFLVTMYAKYLLSSKMSVRSQEITLRYSKFFLIPAIQCFSLKVYALFFINFEVEK